MRDQALLAHPVVQFMEVVQRQVDRVAEQKQRRARLKQRLLVVHCTRDQEMMEQERGEHRGGTPRDTTRVNGGDVGQDPRCIVGHGDRSGGIFGCVSFGGSS